MPSPNRSNNRDIIQQGWVSVPNGPNREEKKRRSLDQIRHTKARSFYFAFASCFFSSSLYSLPSFLFKGTCRGFDLSIGARARSWCDWDRRRDKTGERKKAIFRLLPSAKLLLSLPHLPVEEEKKAEEKEKKKTNNEVSFSGRGGSKKERLMIFLLLEATNENNFNFIIPPPSVPGWCPACYRQKLLSEDLLIVEENVGAQNFRPSDKNSSHRHLREIITNCCQVTNIFRVFFFQ